MPLNNENNNECCKCTTPEYELILNEQGPQGRQGEKGNEGFSPTVTINTNTDQVYSLTITTADGQIVTPNLKASVPGTGTAGQVLTKNSDTPYDMSFQSLPQAQDNQAGVVQLATENDLEPDSEGEVDSTKAVTPNLLSTYVEQEINNADDKYVTLDTEQQITGKKTFSFNDGIFANSIKEINQGSTIITYNQDTSNILIGSTGANTSNITLRTKQDGQLLYQKGTNNSLQIITSEDIATTSKAGIVKPDGTTITIDTDGTLHGAEQGTVDYNELTNKPTINNIELEGALTSEELGLAETQEVEELGNKLNTLSSTVTNLQTSKQDKLTAGANITISDDNVISATGSSYTLPQATSSVLGGIKVGENLSITEDGILSADTYNKSTLDTKFEEKQDILTATNGISIERKTISNVEGFSYTSDATAIYNTGGWGVLAPSGQNWDVSRVPGINALIGTSITATTFPSRIVMPYTFGQIVKFPTWGNTNTVINGAISFGKLAEDGTFYPIWFPEGNRYYYTADDNIIQEAGNFTQIHFYSYKDWGQNPTNTKFAVFAHNTAYGYMQLKVTDSDLKLNYTNGSSNRSYMNQYYKTDTAILNRFREVNAVMFVPYYDVFSNIKIGVDQGSAIPVTSIGLYANTMDLYDSAEQLDSHDFGENLFDIGGVQAHNYISINIDDSTIKINDAGQLYASSSAPANMVTTDTNQIISGVKDFSALFKTNKGISLRGSITARDSNDGINPTIIDYKNGPGNIILGEIEQYTHSSMMKNVGIEIRQNNTSNDAGLYAHKGTDVYPLFDSSNIPTGALKYWTGTETEYTGLTTKNADTLYRTTDTNKVYLGTIQLGGA